MGIKANAKKLANKFKKKGNGKKPVPKKPVPNNVNAKKPMSAPENMQPGNNPMNNTSGASEAPFPFPRR